MLGCKNAIILQSSGLGYRYLRDSCLQSCFTLPSPSSFLNLDTCSCVQDLVDAGFSDAFAYAVLHKIDGRSAAASYVLERNNM